MTEIVDATRSKEALEELDRHLNNGGWSHDYVKSVVDAALRPPPEFEEVEECAGWVAVNRHRETGSPVIGGVYPPDGKEGIPEHPDRIEVKEIRAKIKRPVKRAVVKEVEFPCRIARHESGIRATFNIFVDGFSEENAQLRDSLDGKTGTLIFRFTE